MFATIANLQEPDIHQSHHICSVVISVETEAALYVLPWRLSHSVA